MQLKLNITVNIKMTNNTEQRCTEINKISFTESEFRGVTDICNTIR